MRICLKIVPDFPAKLAEFVHPDGIHPMFETYDAHGIRFRYPSDWDVSEHVGEGEVLITVASPETSFWSISLFADCPAPEAVISTAVDAFREEYEDLDVYEAVASLCGRPTLARDLEFFCLELLNSAWIRAFSTPDFTVLVLFQANDQELPTTRSLFDQMSQTLICDGRGDRAHGSPWS